jgi:hypothetical protein
MLLPLLAALALAEAPADEATAPVVVDRSHATRLVVRPAPAPVAVRVLGVDRESLAGDAVAEAPLEEEEASPNEDTPLDEEARPDEEAPLDEEARRDPEGEPSPRRTGALTAGRVVEEAPATAAEPEEERVEAQEGGPAAPGAGSGGPEAGADPAEADPMDLLRNSVNEPLQPLSRSQHRWLKPTRGKLDPNPYQQIDFTAYTLEFGEVKVGLAAITVGIAPRVQLGTVPIENAVGVYNLHAKANLFRLQGFDLAVRGAVHWLPLGDFDGLYLDVGGLASQQLHERVSIHVGGAYTRMTARGVPDLTRASPLVTAVTGDLSGFNPPPEWFGPDAPGIQAEALAARVAVDVRINRRDSFILQGQTLLRAAVVSDIGDLEISEVLPPIAGLDEALSYQGQFAVTEAYIASLAYQASWKQVDLRIGVGISSVPGAWVLQANELSYRFGGKTRRNETRTRKGWRRNRMDVAPPQEPVAPPPLPAEDADQTALTAPS